MPTHALRITVLVPGRLDEALTSLAAWVDRFDRGLGGCGVHQVGYAGRGRRVTVKYRPTGRRGTWPARARLIAATFREMANRGPMQ